MEKTPTAKFGIVLIVALLVVLGGYGAWLASNKASQEAASIKSQTKGDLQSKTSAYADLITRYKVNPGNATIQSELIALATERNRQIVDLIKKGDTQTAYNAAVSSEQRAALPPEAQKLTEQKVANVTGTIRVFKTDDFDKEGKATDKPPKYYYKLLLPNGNEVDLYLPAAVQARGLLSGATVTLVQGIQVTTSGEDGDYTILATVATPQYTDGIVESINPLLSTATTKQVAIIMVIPSFVTTPNPNFTKANMEALIFNSTNSVKKFYQNSSNGKANVIGRVFGPYVVSVSCGAGMYDWGNNIISKASRLAKNDGMDSSYQYQSYIAHNIYGPSSGAPGAYPNDPPSGCNGSAWGELGGQKAFWVMNLGMTSALPPAKNLIHELGHNFGLHHSNKLVCRNQSNVIVQYSTNCTSAEYGDATTTMGGGTSGELAGVQKKILGYLSSANVQTITASGTYTIQGPSETVGSGVKLLEIPFSESGSPKAFYIDYKQPLGFDNYTDFGNTFTALQIRVSSLPPYGGYQTQLLDMGAGFVNQSNSPLLGLPVGQTFNDTVNDIHVTLNSLSSSSASVTVTFGANYIAPPPMDTTAPTVTLTSPTNNAAVAKGAPLTLTATAIDNVGVNQVTFYVNGNIGCTDVTSPYACSWQVPNAPNKTYQIIARAYDQGGNTGSSSTATVTSH